MPRAKLQAGVVVACCVSLIGFAVWTAVAILVFNPQDLELANTRACTILGIECTPDQQGDSLFDLLREAELELALLSTSGDASAMRDQHASVAELENQISEAEGHFPTGSLAIVVSGVLLQILLAFALANCVWQLGRKLIWRRLLSRRRRAIRCVMKTWNSRQQWPRDKIAKSLVSLDESEDADPGSETGREILTRLQQVVNRDLPNPYSRNRSYWSALSKLLYQVLRACIETGEVDAESPEYGQVRKQRSRVRLVIWLGYAFSIAQTISLGGAFFGFYYLIAFIHSVLPGQLGLVGALLYADWVPVVMWIVPLGWTLALVSYATLQCAVRWWTEKTRTELDDVIAAALSAPVAILPLVIGLGAGGRAMPAYFTYSLNTLWRWATSDNWHVIVACILATWVLVLVFNRIVIFVLSRWARTTEKEYDDMLVRMLRVFGTFIIVAIMGALLLIKFQAQIRTATGIDGILLPYGIIISVLTAILGYSAREGVENLFSAFLLQVDKPFDLGDRLVLETGEICDVSGMGMRTTRLHNVLENTEISVPNRTMVNQKITNISRPDLQLRFSVQIQLPHDKEIVRTAEAILLDAAYFEPEVNQTCVEKDEVPRRWIERGRRSLEEHIQTFNEVLSDEEKHEVMVERIQGRGGYESISVFARINALMDQAKELRTHYGQLVDKGAPSEERYEAILRIAHCIRELGEFVYTLADRYRQRMKAATSALIAELTKEPLIRSSFLIAENGRPYVEMSLSVYATHLERRYVITHKLHREIEKRFAEAGINAILSPSDSYSAKPDAAGPVP
ncbi:mechanosensitive ion channel family protein [Candidatus Bipolaricaulota bacterium]